MRKRRVLGRPCVRCCFYDVCSDASGEGKRCEYFADTEDGLISDTELGGMLKAGRAAFRDEWYDYLNSYSEEAFS